MYCLISLNQEAADKTEARQGPCLLKQAGHLIKLPRIVHSVKKSYHMNVLVNKQNPGTRLQIALKERIIFLNMVKKCWCSVAIKREVGAGKGVLDQQTQI